MNTARKGNGKELRSAELLAADGWTVASRRHVGGAGDLLAVKPGERPLLIEVKATAKPPWFSSWGPERRAELLEGAKVAGAVPLLAWWRPRARAHQLLESWEWP